MALAERSGPKPPPRVNPLINAFSRPPREEPKPDPKPTQAAPPPPPPPAASASSASSSEPAPEPAKGTYSATRPDTFIDVDISTIISSKAADYSRAQVQEDPMTRPRVRSAAATGRTVFVRTAAGGPNKAPTVNGALMVLNRVVKQSKVANKYHSQKAHERRGMKRKRLSSERWRARFKAGFCEAYKRVHEIRKQGW